MGNLLGPKKSKRASRKKLVGGKLGLWSPQPGPQTAAITADALPVLLYGGAKYGGKSDFLLGDFLQDVPTYNEHWHGMLVRRTIPELQEIIQRSQEIYPLAGGEWKEQKKTWVFPGGSTLVMGSIEREADIPKYQGFSKTWIGIDEAGNWPTDAIFRRFALACCRWGRASVPTKRIRLTANPGGVGHQWLKDLLIDPAPQGFQILEDSKSGEKMVYVPSRIEHNLIGMERDPGYVDRLKGLGSPQLVRAWLEGDWNAIQGAYFEEFSLADHVIRPFTIPDDWTKFLAFDWGASAPFCALWITVSDGRIPEIPSGALVVYREWYGASSPGKGLKLATFEICDGILQMSCKEKLDYSVADPAMFANLDGPSLAEKYAEKGVYFTRAKNDRVTGWSQVRDRLVGQDGRPMLFIFDSCKDLIRTLPVLQISSSRPEDLDTDGEDHAADALRYGLMSRPWVKVQSREKNEQVSRFSSRAVTRSGQRMEVDIRQHAEILNEKFRR